MLISNTLIDADYSWKVGFWEASRRKEVKVGFVNNSISDLQVFA
jgi:hypothetical protein